MTVIVFDGVSVAADRQAGAGGKMRFHRPLDKLIVSRDGNRLYAISGSYSNFTAWIRWYEGSDSEFTEPRNPRRLPEACDNDDFLVFQRTLEREQHRHYSKSCPYGDKIDEPDAWGSGCDWAIGALDFGATAIEACQVATKRCRACGNGFTAVDLSTMTYITDPV